MMLQLYSPLSRWSILCLLIFFLKKFCFSSMASPKPWCLHFIEFQTQTWVIYVFTWMVVPLCAYVFVQQSMWPLLKLSLSQLSMQWAYFSLIFWSQLASQSVSIWETLIEKFSVINIYCISHLVIAVCLCSVFSVYVFSFWLISVYI